MQKGEILLRALVDEDKEQLAWLANNKNIANNLRDYFPNPYTTINSTTFINLTKEEKPQRNFAIVYRGELCGVIGLNPQSDVYRKSAEIGYWLGETYWGRGIALEAVKIITRYGFEDLGFLRLYTGVFEYNIASMKVLEKAGYQKEGVFSKAVFKNGFLIDEHRYAIVK